MIFTLGHSVLDPQEFAAAARGMDVIADVRSHPGSTHSPQFNKEEMSRWLPALGFDYEWWPGLGGWNASLCVVPQLAAQMLERDVDIAAYAGRGFPKQRINKARQLVGAEPEWTNYGFYDYSWYMAMGNFLGSVDLLLHASEGKNWALLCCESTWWRCHRGMIADYLHWRGVPVYHLPVRPPKRETTPRYRPHVIGDRLERYHPEILRAWQDHAKGGDVQW